MITVTREELKKDNLPEMDTQKMTAEQARVIAEIIYNLLTQTEDEETRSDENQVA